MTDDMEQLSFKLSELSINPNTVLELMGYQEDAPEEFLQMVKDELSLLHNVDEIQGAYVIKEVQILEKSLAQLQIEDTIFSLGKTVSHYYQNAEKMAVFVCTAGKTISDRAKDLMASGMYMEGYVVDVLGTVIVEKATDLLQAHLNQQMSLQGLNCTNRYSPGYAQWDVAEQTKLFSFLPPKCCQITLTDSCLMTPAKSVSGFIGIGSRVKNKVHVCSACSSLNCLYRNKKSKCQL